MSLRREFAFWLMGGLLGTLMIAASAPSPLYGVYQAIWHFSAVTLTAVFAVYAVALLAAPRRASLPRPTGRRRSRPAYVARRLTPAKPGRHWELALPRRLVLSMGGWSALAVSLRSWRDTDD
jgi:hypothetical protein